MRVKHKGNEFYIRILDPPPRHSENAFEIYIKPSCGGRGVIILIINQSSPVLSTSWVKQELLEVTVGGEEIRSFQLPEENKRTTGFETSHYSTTSLQPLFV